MSYNKWHPKLKRGFFYVGDQQFYLFSDKITRTLSQATFYQWELPSFPISIITASIGDVVISPEDLISEDNYIRIRSTIATNDVTFEYTTQSVSSNIVIQTIVPTTLAIASAESVYYLDTIPVSGYPIIFTDGNSTPSHYEFDVNHDTGELTFHNRIPSTGMFEYEGSADDYVTIKNIDLNPINIGRGTGILGIGVDTTPNISEDLY